MSKGGIFILEEFRDAEEESGGFLSAESFTNVEEVDDFGEEDTTFSR